MDSKRGRGKKARLKSMTKIRSRGKLRKLSSEDSPIDDDDDEHIINSVEIEEEKPQEMIIPEGISLEEDILQLETPTFTTIDRAPPEPMLRLKWDHPVNLLGGKVLSPMIHVCELCHKPILVYGRMIACKHVFCWSCLQNNLQVCPRCNEKVGRVEKAGLGSIFMCTHGGTRYGTTGCRRTYMSSRDLQAHVIHRHSRTSHELSENCMSSKLDVKKEPLRALEPSPRDPRYHHPDHVIDSHTNYQQGSHIPVVNTRTSTLITVPLHDTPPEPQSYQQPMQFSNPSYVQASYSYQNTPGYTQSHLAHYPPPSLNFPPPRLPAYSQGISPYSETNYNAQWTTPPPRHHHQPPSSSHQYYR